MDSGKPLTSGAARLLLVLLVALYVGWFTYHSIDRWANLNNDWWDVGNIDSAAYNTAHGKFMYSNAELGSFWSDHFAPILLVLSGYYLFDDGYWFIYFWQSLSIGLTAVPIFLLGREFFGDERVGLLAALVYLTNGYVHAGNLFDYHMVSHIGLFTFSAFYAMVRKRWGWYFFFGALLMFCKEDAPIIFFTLGFYALFVQKERKMALATWAVSGLYLAFVFKLAIPYLRETSHNVWGDRATYYYNKDYTWLGETTADKIRTLLTQPVETLRTVFANPMRAERWLLWFGGYAFLPILSLTGLIIVVPSSLELMLNSRVTVSSLLFHYPLMLAPLYTLAVFLALANMRRAVEGLRAGWMRFGARAPLAFNGAGYITITTVMAYAGAILFFLVFGAFEFSAMGARVHMDNLEKPLLIMMVALLAHALVAPESFLSKLFGKDASTRVTVIPLLYMLSVNVLVTKDNVPLVLSDDGARVFRKNEKLSYDDVFINPASFYSREHREHARIVRESVRDTIPKGATVVTSPETYGIMYHNVNTFLYRGMDNHPFDQMRVDYAAIDLKGVPVRIGPPIYDKKKAIGELLRNPGFGLILERDGLFIFKRSAPKKADYEWYLSRALNYHVSELGAGVGEMIEDEEALEGRARKASKEKTPAGYLVYGPYVNLLNGEYKAIFRLKVSGAAGAAAGGLVTLDVVADEARRHFAKRTLTGEDLPDSDGWIEKEIPFEIVKDDGYRVEFRLYYHGGADVVVDSVRLSMPFDAFMENAFVPHRRFWTYQEEERAGS